MCLVPAGMYELGLAPTATSMAHDFFIDRFEVTNARFELFRQANRAKAPVCAEATGTYDPQGAPEQPVVCVSRNTAAAFCSWAGKRLPSGNEWEAAARGTDGRRFPWGDAEPNPCRAVATIVQPDCVGYLCQGGPAPQWTDDGALTFVSGASPFGPLHMAGNVWEWVVDDGPAGKACARGGSFADEITDLQVWSQHLFTGVFHDVGFRCVVSVQDVVH